MEKFYITKSDDFGDWQLTKADGVPIMTAPSHPELLTKIKEEQERRASIFGNTRA